MIRLQKLLANSGLGSRRKVDGWITQGRVEVDGKIALPGLRVTGQEHIRVDGKPVRIQPANDEPVVLVYHKPVNEICSRSDPQGRVTVFDHLPRPKSGRWISVGRLDINSCGLLLFTTNGDLANRLMHPSTEMVREYKVRIQGEPDAAVLESLRKGVSLDDGVARFAAVTPGPQTGSNCWFTVQVREGRNRLVRRLWEAVGFRVNRLLRVRFGPVRLPRDLPPGKSMPLSGHQLDALLQASAANKAQTTG